jgi:fused signal recognition particle receptor
MAELMSKWKHGLERTRKATFGRIATFFGSSEINAQTWDELEAILVQADMGIETTEKILVKLKQEAKNEGIVQTSIFQKLLYQELLSLLDPAPPVIFNSEEPTVIMLVGVNGSGKTTTAAKLGKQFASQGKKVLLVAADTYRAAAIDQLQVWADRLGLPVIASQLGADPGAITYDGIQSAIARKMEVVIIDTAGRLHTRYNLMEELKKVRRVANKALAGAPHFTWLVMDATTGQNALQQANSFKNAVEINGVILAKLDSSARGGMAFAIQNSLGLPIIYAGLGEKPEDLQPFDKDSFVDGILQTR